MADFEETIVCPSCGELDWEFTDYPHELNHDGDEALHTCGYCGADMKVTLCVEYTYSTQKHEQ